MAKKIRSRLAQKESRRLMKQTMIFGGLSIVVLIVSVVFGIPAIIRFASLFQSPSSTPQAADIPPLPPSFRIPYEATFSPEIKIEGFAGADSQITLYREQTPVATVETDQEGYFEVSDIELAPGNNSFTATTTRNGLKSNSSAPQAVVFDNQAPSLEVLEPSDGQRFGGPLEQVLIIKLTTDPRARLNINGRSGLADLEGNYELRYSLNQGDNAFEITALDEAGNTTSTSLTVRYDP